jgi:putative hydrolase of the HAD superfamily
MIQAIFFDFDGVLTLNSSGHTHTWDALAEKINVNSGAMYDCINPFNSDLYEGRKTLEDIWSELMNCLDADIDIAVMNEIYTKTPRNEDMYVLVHTLHENYSLGIITDNMSARVEALKEKFEISALFSTVQISGDVGSGKHDDEIFRRALEAVDVKPEKGDLLFR